MSDLFKVRDHVPDFDGYLAENARRNAATIAGARADRNIAYGSGPKDRLDLYYPKAPASGPRPVHMFIHGGYWRAFGKDDFCYVAEAIAGCGAIAAIVDYELMPVARMETLVSQVRRAMSWLARNAASFGGDAERLTVSGHSAGGHLAVMCCVKGLDFKVRAALPVSGLYDLEPLTRAFIQEEVRFTPEEVERFTPLNLDFDPETRYDIMVGGLETAPFHQQADAFAARLRAQGAKPERSTPAGFDHMSVVLALGTPGSIPARHLARCIGA